MEPDCLSLETVRAYMQYKGCKVANHVLVKKFKIFLNDPISKDTARLLFKDIVNTIATVQKEGDAKYLVLKPDFINESDPIDDENVRERELSESPPNSTASSMVSSISENAQIPVIVPAPLPPMFIETPSREDIEVRRAQIEFQTPVDHLSHSQSSPNLSNQYSAVAEWDDSQGDSVAMEDDADGLLSPPRPPPRRRAMSRGKENIGSKIEEKLRQFNEVSPTKSVHREEELLELSLSPGTVKEKAERLNKMTSSEVDLTSKHLSSSPNRFVSSSSLNSLTGIRRHQKNDDDDSSSVTTLDARSKEWLLKAAKGDYHALAKLLKEEPKLAGFKDFISGFTALHWAAKHGNPDMVKLIAGSHKINPNVRSHGGYTPLHIAALFRHEEIMELLVNTYGADPSIRDYGGKRAHQYLPASSYADNFYQSGAAGTVDEHHRSLPHQSNKTNGTWSNTEAAIQGAFVRIGSLNSKVRKTAASVMQASSHHSSSGSSSKKNLSRIKSWGSADSLQPTRQQSSNSLMPPPKHPPKKKKVKRGSTDHSSLPAETTSKTKPENNNSDSDGGFGTFGS